MVAQSEVTWGAASFSSSATNGCIHFDIISTNARVCLSDDVLKISLGHALITCHLVFRLAHLARIMELIGGGSG